MDEIDKREKRAETNINIRYSGQGKGDADRTSQKEFSEGYEGIDWSKKGDKQ